MRRIATFALAAACSLFLSLTASPQASDDYLRGYARALLDGVYDLPQVELRVEDGVVRLSGCPTSETLRESLAAALSNVEGIRSVSFADAPAPQTPPDSGWKREVNESTAGLFPRGDLFEPLVADPWESRFFLSYRANDDLDNSGVVGFGEVLPLYRWLNAFTPGLDVQFNIEGAAFGHFNMEDGGDLENIDFQVGFPLIFRYDDFAARLRYVHRSGHLGDDYIVRNLVGAIEVLDRQMDRNLFDVTLSYGPGWWRVYGGPVFNFDDIQGRDLLEGVIGAEYRPWSHLSIHPVFGVHVTAAEEEDWDPNHRWVGGLEFKDWPYRDRTLRLLFEYYNGVALSFPAFTEDGDYFGLGVYLDI